MPVPFHSGFWKTRNDGIFRGTFFKNFRNGSKWSKYTYVWVVAYSERYFSRYEIFWKTRHFRRNSAEFFKSLKTDSKQFEMVQTYPSMSLGTFINVLKLILNNLAKHGIFDGIPYNMPIDSINTFYSTVWFLKCSSIILCQFEDHRSDTLPLRNFFKRLETDSRQFQMVQTYPSMSLRTVVNVI